MFAIDARKLIRGTFYPYPAPEFAGKTIRQNLEEITGKSIVVKVTYGMGGTLYVCGNVEIERIFASKGEQAVSSWAILSLWNTPGIIDIVWPPIPLDCLEDTKGQDPLAEISQMVPAGRSRTKDSPRESTSTSSAVVCPVPQMDLFSESGNEPPSTAEDLFQAGYQELSAGHIDAALDYLRQSVTLDPKSAKAWSALGAAFEEATQDDDAIEAYRNATDLDRYQWATLLQFGRLLVRRRRVGEAIEKLETAFRLSKRNQEVRATLALAYAQSGRPDRAAELMSA